MVDWSKKGRGIRQRQVQRAIQASSPSRMGATPQGPQCRTGCSLMCSIFGSRRIPEIHQLSLLISTIYSRGHISRTISGKAWSHVGGPVVPADGPAVGERAGMSKLTRAQVVEICNQYAAGGITQKDLASEHGVSVSTVRKVTNKYSWAHIPGKPVRTPKRISPALRGEGNPQAKVTASQAQEIYSLAHSRELSDAEIARRYNVAQSRVSDIRCGRTWAHVTGHADLPSALSEFRAYQWDSLYHRMRQSPIGRNR